MGDDWWVPLVVIPGFFVMFVILHYASPCLVVSIFGKRHGDAYENLPSANHRSYWRRLVRSQVYYIYAGIMGTVLIIVEYRSVEELIFKYNRVLQINLCVALSHWLLAVLEDVRSASLLSADMRHPLIVVGIALIYLVHHAVTIFAFVFIISTNDLSSLGVFGLAFEVPVAIQSFREFSVMMGDCYKKDELPWFVRQWRDGASDTTTRPPRSVDVYWFFFFLSILVFRIVPVGLFLYSVAFWQKHLEHLSLVSKATYYVLGGTFTIANPVYAMLQMAYCMNDYSQKTGGDQDIRSVVDFSAFDNDGDVAFTENKNSRRPSMNAL